MVCSFSSVLSYHGLVVNISLLLSGITWTIGFFQIELYAGLAVEIESLI